MGTPLRPKYLLLKVHGAFGMIRVQLPLEIPKFGQGLARRGRLVWRRLGGSVEGLSSVLGA